jgi:transcriptional/translational regulatory protein YebC/TACO1
MFDRKGVITLSNQGKTEDDIMELVLDAGAEDIQTEDDFFEITSAIEDFENVRKAILDGGLEVENASLQWIAKNTVEVGGDEAEKLVKMIDAIEDNDDVQNLFTNADFKDE